MRRTDLNVVEGSRICQRFQGQSSKRPLLLIQGLRLFVHLHGLLLPSPGKMLQVLHVHSDLTGLFVAFPARVMTVALTAEVEATVPLDATDSARILVQMFPLREAEVALLISVHFERCFEALCHAIDEALYVCETFRADLIRLGKS